MTKKKILMLCDHPLSTSGVGTQARYLISGLVDTGKYSFRVLGGAIRHESYETVAVNPDFIIKPIDGFGDPNMIRVLLATERPDALMLFTDPRFFFHIFSHEDEIHQICPIVYNHLWDQCEFAPLYNKVIYDSVDLLNCINRPTYDFLKSLYPEDKFPGKVNWTPHALPKQLFFPLSKDEQLATKRKLFNRSDDEFVVLWVNRNARRKNPGDVLWSWKQFLDLLEQKHGHKKATLVMHTDPFDPEGPNLAALVEMLNIKDRVIFSKDRTSFQDMNKLYNACDTVINFSCAEGFGLATLEAMYCGKPIIAVKTGGLERQVVDYRDGSENGIALHVEYKTLVGSQMVPGIVEDHVTNESKAKALLHMFELGDENRRQLGQKAMNYAHEEFDMGRLIQTWDTTLEDTIANWKQRDSRWEVVKF